MQNEWIKSSERKPDDNRNVIVALLDDGKKRVTSGYFADTHGGWIMNDEFCKHSEIFDDTQATHWMDFPKHPEIEKGGEHERHI